MCPNLAFLTQFRFLTKFSIFDQILEQKSFQICIFNLSSYLSLIFRWFYFSDLINIFGRNLRAGSYIKASVVAELRRKRNLQWAHPIWCIRKHYDFLNYKFFAEFKKVCHILVKSWSFGQKSKFWSNTEMLVKNWNFGQKLKFSSKIEILVKNLNFVKNWNFGQKLKFWSKIKILVKNWNLAQKLKFWSKIEILSKIKILVKN